MIRSHMLKDRETAARQIDVAGVKLKQARVQFRFSRSKHPDFLKLDARLFRLRSPDIAKQADRAAQPKYPATSAVLNDARIVFARLIASKLRWALAVDSYWSSLFIRVVVTIE